MFCLLILGRSKNYILAQKQGGNPLTLDSLRKTNLQYYQESGDLTLYVAVLDISDSKKNGNTLENITIAAPGTISI